jgi:hypothetical protein
MTASGSAYPRRTSVSRPVLPHSTSYTGSTVHEVDTPEYNTDESESEGLDTAATSVVASDHRSSLTYQTPDVTDEDKIKAIIDEFGDIASLMEPLPGQSEPEPERMLAECMGSLFK